MNESIAFPVRNAAQDPKKKQVKHAKKVELLKFRLILTSHMCIPPHTHHEIRTTGG